MRSRLLSALMLLVLLSSVAVAATWPQLEKKLQDWSGDKEIVIAGEQDPLADEALMPLVELLLESGYVVLTDPSAGAKGLILEKRATAQGTTLVLKRAADGGMLALQRLSEQPPAVAVSRPQPVPLAVSRPAVAPAVVAPAPAAISVPLVAPSQRIDQVRLQAAVVAGSDVLFELDGHPLRIAVWPGRNPESFELFLLYDKTLERYRCDGRELKHVSSFVPPSFVSAGLSLDVADMNQDGTPELAVVWTEDYRGVADGTDSHLHSWLLGTGSEQLAVLSGDLEGYLHFVGHSLKLQRRSEFSLFAPELFEVELAGDNARVRPQPETENRWLMNYVVWPDASQRLVWNADQRLMLEDAQSRQRRAGTTLLLDFGKYQGSPVHVRLETPEYRSGFSAADKVMSKPHFIVRRLQQVGADVFTLVRGRTPGLPLVGRASGKDQLVQIESVDGGLQARYPFAAVEAFMLDFGILTADGTLTAVALMNEKEDGQGAAYLCLQKAQH
ncbi:MAG: hypothetical protein JXR59_09035 [Desulfuromonadaceae bacterium]|nr:hypothetical protein [Desulfuromonadaceae bacterium]